MSINLPTLIAYLVAIVIPVIAFLAIRALDLFGTSKWDTVITCALWGLFGAFGIAYIVNNQALQLLVDLGLTNSEGYQTIVRFVAPIIEEVLKAVILIYIFRRPSFRYFVDGAIYGFSVGIGFAVMENYFYIANSGTAALSLAVSRVLSTSLMHAMASGVVGISLGRLRRQQGGSVILPLAGIALAILAHILYNNIVNTLTGPALLLVAILFGLGGAAFIGLQINLGLKQEKQRFTQSLNQKSDVSDGERIAIQSLGEGSKDQIWDHLERSLGDENIELIRKLLLTQANIGILQNNLENPNISDRLQEAWTAEITERKIEFQAIRKQLNRTVMSYLQTVFPTQDESMWNWLLEEFSSSDPTMVHTFDVFMRTSGLASSLSAAQLSEMAERLHHIEIFKNVSLADLENLGRAIEVTRFSDQEQLFDQGDEGDAMYLIEDGRIAIYSVDDLGREKKLRVFERGQVVGDFAVLDGQPRSARARAQGDLVALVLRRQMFKIFIQSRPQVILAVLAVLAERARYTTSAVEDSINTARQIAEGRFAEISQRSAQTVTAKPTENTELSSDVKVTLDHAFAKFATTLQGQDSVSDKA